MICFCKKEDLLSQWRGYAKEGIAIEFDFSKGLYGPRDGFSSYHFYTIMNADDEKEWISKDDDAKSLMIGAIVSPYKVIYTDSECESDDIIAKKVDAILIARGERQQQYAVSMIPYIKNKHFDEEEECRLLFDMRQLIAGEEWLLSKKYVYLDVDGVKKPNIRVKFGNQYVAQYEENIVLYYVEDTLTDSLKKFKKMFKAEGVNIQLVRKVRKFAMERDEILLSEGKNQEKVCTRLRHFLYPQNIKIWCDGHMPIRKIYIGPSKDAELMKFSIEEYIKTKYWMKDIEVIISSIPLRT